jgi:Family of unknown function (DUF6055)
MTTLPSSPLARRLTAVAGALVLTLAVGSQAHAADRAAQLRADRPGAERALARAQALAHGRGVRDGRELSPALASLSARISALSPADRKAANALLARPTDPGQTGQPGGPYTVADVQAYSQHFCFHWVESTADAPSLADDDNDGIPNYIVDVADIFENVYAAEHDDLGWRLPKSDVARGGCDWNGDEGLTDVYIKDIGKLGLYGYASPDPDQATSDTTRYGYLVMDDDYSAAEFPGYENDQLAPLKVTAAHEYNHVLQYAYDILEDKWMFESTATWMEEKVYPDIDDYHQYLDPWSERSTMPITLADSSKMYGSAVFNRWLDDAYGQDIVRRAWERSAALGSFAPGTYDAAIREAHGPGFSYELMDLAAASAEWQTSDSGVHEGATFPAMKRIPVKLPHDGSTITGKLDHTGYALFDVQLSNAPKLKLTGGLPAGVAGGIAIVGLQGDDQWRIVNAQPQGGHTSITIENPGRFSRITAVVVNADYANAGWGGSDWKWTHDQQPIELSVSEVSDGGGNPGDGGNPGGNPGGGGNTGGGGHTGGGNQTGGGIITQQITPPALVQLSKGAAPRLKKAKALTISASANMAGAFSARATVSAKTAKALHLGRKAMTIGTGKATLAGAGATKVRIKLTSKARAKLREAKKAVTVIVRVTFTPASGSPTTGALKVKLKP